ncbi:hypothetical protein DA2_3785 [Desulfovibrio sp. A2]|nr:hypothetical protein DA2_3785 [Desulfovibrio sp. A2]
MAGRIPLQESAPFYFPEVSCSFPASFPASGICAWLGAR